MVTKKVVEYGWIEVFYCTNWKFFFFLCTNWKVRILFLCEMGYNVGDLSNASHATILGVRFFFFFFSIIPNGGPITAIKPYWNIASRMGYRIISSHSLGWPR